MSNQELLCHPAVSAPYRAAALGFFLGLAARTVWALLDPWSASLLSVLLLASFRDFFLPTHFRFDDQGITISGALRATRKFPWNRFRSFIVDRNGLFLSPYTKPRWLESQRGVFLALSCDQRQEVQELCLERHLARRTA